MKTENISSTKKSFIEKLTEKSDAYIIFRIIIFILSYMFAGFILSYFLIKYILNTEYIIKNNLLQSIQHSVLVVVGLLMALLVVAVVKEKDRLLMWVVRFISIIFAFMITFGAFFYN